MSLTGLSDPLCQDDVTVSPDAVDGGSARFKIPCFASPALSSMFGRDIWVCDVTLGPTSSWKDCVAPGVVEAALRQGSRRVVVASSGNHGRAIAFACREAGLRAAVLVYERTAPDVVASLVDLGAEVVRYPDRPAVYAGLDGFLSAGWFSATLTDRLRNQAIMPGAEGYHRIAAAITQAIPGDPIVVVPTCYGDGVSAIWRNLAARGRRPLMGLVRAESDRSIACSLATDIVTSQVRTLKAAGAFDMRLEDAAFRSGIVTMEAALGKRLDLAEGGIPEALTRIIARMRDDPDAAAAERRIVCVVTGSVFPDLDRRR